MSYIHSNVLYILYLKCNVYYIYNIHYTPIHIYTHIHTVTVLGIQLLFLINKGINIVILCLMSFMTIKYSSCNVHVLKPSLDDADFWFVT